METDSSPDRLEWDAKMPFIGKTEIRHILLGIAIAGLFLTMLLVGIELASPTPASVVDYLVVGVVMTGFLLLLIFLATALLHVVTKGGNVYRFIIDKDGAAYLPGKSAEKMTDAMAVLGLLSGNATVAGAGLIARGQASGGIRWKEVKSVQLIPQEKKIYIARKALINPVLICCTDETYPMAVDLVRRYSGKKPQ
ncbi:hypothetical protein J2T58_002134 [Methanocalculus alkaliphilus]|uniref:hypothetical protein n=1 Tax=Methanocalculus alkaliphilus TaxID=768730 RepID=UPI00209D5C21|nr:hypothetical protein [Methanocalculus alkaliphilus]MCP1716258.1 hypothetical protein [Methanocalculus alkaliphilus]